MGYTFFPQIYCNKMARSYIRYYSLYDLFVKIYDISSRTGTYPINTSLWNVCRRIRIFTKCFSIFSYDSYLIFTRRYINRTAVMYLITQTQSGLRVNITVQIGHNPIYHGICTKQNPRDKIRWGRLWTNKTDPIHMSTLRAKVIRWPVQSRLVLAKYWEFTITVCNILGIEWM